MIESEESYMSNTIHFHIPRWKEIPDIGLYMDQVVTYVNGSLRPFFDEMAVPPITKSMVNNYVKAKVVDAPEKKKYSRLSIAMILVVYIMKQVYSTEDISRLISLGMGLDDSHEITYDRFCEAIENATRNIFSENVSISREVLPGRDNKYLMDMFAISFAGKFYVLKEFLNAEKP